MTVLESNASLPINLRINDSGVGQLTAGFLKRWRGHVRLHCTRRWHPGSRWFSREVRDALVSGQLKPLGLLSLSVQGRALLPLIEMLLEIGSAILQLEITYAGNGSELLSVATPFASLGHTLTMNISVQGQDSEGREISSWMHRLLESRIKIKSLNLRSSIPSSVYTSCFDALLPLRCCSRPARNDDNTARTHWLACTHALCRENGLVPGGATAMAATQGLLPSLHSLDHR